jgi:VanZ family protein
MLLIFIASSVPGDQLPGTISDKLAHLLVYAVLGACFMLPLSGGRLAGMTRMNAAWALALSIAYGITDEFHQSFTRGRTPDANDLVADSIGAAIGILGVLAIAAISARFRPTPRR